ncbi:phage tail terminator family protein [Cohnella silvisoli]|uniref:Uncharacterized protein n=1 Tax=Cohnella silvisoli TaxID=2873699 RepID=A0ABV1L4P8_9BACL|nr:hypothetical protein [Cohnella silvisoli]MCD9026046.1 hypothetical protein [Cohnella silvisoli]
MAVKVNDVLNGVTRALAEQFPNMPRYCEEIKQELNAPCFFVKLFPIAQGRGIHRRYVRYYTFDIHYFPDPDKEENEDAHDIVEQLYDNMEYLYVGASLCRCSRMRHEIVNGVMHFFFSIDMQLIKQITPSPLMETATIKETIK